ncbi:hypothetical protein [Foetidibacter luteolus]|uniref:hypothetical protein n=1 Tax=Foetidibacter luteolus TaxID=2608880 RepID=UPI00129BAD8E|nr:hypothetical protein [Foetidibacter luteolus]
MKLHLVDENNFYMVSLFVNTGAAHAFFNLVKSLHLIEKFKLKLVPKEDKTLLCAEQFGALVKWYRDYNVILPADAAQRTEYFTEMIKHEILPALQKLPNPFPLHPHYKPLPKRALYGGYFNAQQSYARVVGPMSEAERTDVGYGKG